MHPRSLRGARGIRGGPRGVLLSNSAPASASRGVGRRLALRCVALGPKSAKPRTPRSPAEEQQQQKQQLAKLPEHEWPAAPPRGGGGAPSPAATTAPAAPLAPPPPSSAWTDDDGGANGKSDWSSRLLQLGGGGKQRRRRRGGNPTATAPLSGNSSNGAVDAAAAAQEEQEDDDDDDDDDVIFGGRAAAPASALENDEDYDAEAAAEDAAIIAAAMEQYGGFNEQQQRRGRRGRGNGNNNDSDGDDDDDELFRSRSRSRGAKKRLPAAVRCFDTARICVKAGDGGAGCVAFRREPYVERGGPNGGNGGRGGNVWAVADAQLNSLTPFRHRVHWRADGGTPGKGSQCDGADGEDAEVPVPLGTIVRARGAREGDPPLAELVAPGQRALLCVGGRGGRGNASFKTARDTAPALAERGEPGEELWLDLELKVVADVGLVGAPNAGKSTLLSVLTAAKPKIAPYPFTTLVPNLGVCERDYRTTVFADIPGLLEGAHDGRGLGHEFLRHASRCRALVHVVDGSSPDPVGDLRATNAELELFSPDLARKPQVVAYNKVDLPDSGDYWELVRDVLCEEGGEGGLPAERVFPISAATGRGVAELVRGVRALLDEMDAADAAAGGAAGRAAAAAAAAAGAGAGPGRLAAEEAAAAARLSPALTTDALNRTAVPRRFESDARIDDFTVELLAEDEGGGYGSDDEGSDDDEEGGGRGRRQRGGKRGAAAARGASLRFGDDEDEEDDDDALDGFGARSQKEAAAAFDTAVAPQQQEQQRSPYSNREQRRRSRHLAGGALPPAPRGPGGGPRTYLVRGAVLERFTRMTNWDYYESARRFQKVLDVSGVTAALKAAGVREGDTVAIGEDAGEFEWRDAKGDGEAYAAWSEDMRSRGRARAGSSAWPTGR